MPRSATDVAREVVEEGVPCEDIWDEYVSRVEAEGLRFCPIADELIRGECPEEEEEPPSEEVACEALANGLAEAADRGELELSDFTVEIIRAMNEGGDAEAAANAAAEADERGEVGLTDEELELVRCILGEEEEVPCEGLANALAEMADRGELELSDFTVAIIEAINEAGEAEAAANAAAEADQRGETSLTAEELELVRCLLGEEEEGPCQRFRDDLMRREELGQIALSEFIVRLVYEMDTGGDVEAAANAAAEADERGEISLTAEELELVRCLLGPEEGAPVAAPVVFPEVGVYQVDTRCFSSAGRDADCLPSARLVGSLAEAVGGAERFEAQFASRSARVWFHPTGVVSVEGENIVGRGDQVLVKDWGN